MSSKIGKKLKRLETGGLPLIHWAVKRLKLKEILSKYIPPHGNEDIPALNSLLLILYNLTLGRQPLYELEQWAEGINPLSIGYHYIRHGRLNDDRFGRALDKLYWADRSSLMTEIVIEMVNEFELDLSRIHNDSTTVKTYGRISRRTRTGLEMKRGISKEHRPDLKQLVYCLSISSDGAVPIHHKAYAGNRTDDTTHMETWNTIKKITGFPQFLYVADCKVCTEKQLSYIVGHGGRVVSVIPKTRKEVGKFKNELRNKIKAKKVIWRRKIQSPDWALIKYEYFSLFSGNYQTPEGYKIYWIYSNEKKKRDRTTREDLLAKTEKNLLELNVRLNTRKLKEKKTIKEQIDKIFDKYKTGDFFRLKIYQRTEKWKKQITKGRPGSKTKFKICTNTIYILSWRRNHKSLKKEQKIDGIFPLISTDPNITAKEALQAYKYQPRLEKRFTQFKSVHNAAPLLFKKIERVESTMFLFFLALMIQALIEREVRKGMKKDKIKSLNIYPEYRDAYHPTTSKILYNFEGISVYKVMKKSSVLEQYNDQLSDTQKIILKLLNLNLQNYWNVDNL